MPTPLRWMAAPQDPPPPIVHDPGSVRVPAPRRWSARWSVAVTLCSVLLAGGGAQCRSGAGPGPGPHPPSRLDAPPTDPTAHADWQRLEQARAADPTGAQARAIADEILAKDVPLTVRLAALRVRAAHAYHLRDDPTVIAAADEGLGLVTPQAAVESEVVVDLARLRLRALVRGGDPALALAALDDPVVNGRGGMPAEELQGLRAMATDRNGDIVGAVAALVTWRETLTDADPTALWIEHRVARLTDTMVASELAQVVADMPDSPGRACLVAKMGEPLPSAMPAWVERCAQASGGIGMLLPRTGPFAAFADEQLAGTLAAIEVLGDRGPAPVLRWRDSGASSKSARTGANALVGEGARVVVGPIGAKSVKAVGAAVGDRALVIVPGEGSGNAVGVAPSLERRVEDLVALAQGDGRKRLVVLVPDNSYGRRALRAARESALGGFEDAVVERTYPASTTSFGPVINPVMPALREDAALLIPDTLVRAELAIRQLARAGRMAAQGDGPGLMVLMTAEGLEPSTLTEGRDVLEGVWVAPAGPRGPFTEAFEATYLREQGTLPGDQAILVFHALEQAVTGRPGPGAGRVTRMRVEGGQLVVQSTQTEG